MAVDVRSLFWELLSYGFYFLYEVERSFVKSERRSGE